MNYVEKYFFPYNFRYSIQEKNGRLQFEVIIYTIFKIVILFILHCQYCVYYLTQVLLVVSQNHTS